MTSLRIQLVVHSVSKSQGKMVHVKGWTVVVCLIFVKVSAVLADVNRQGKFFKFNQRKISNSADTDTLIEDTL